MVIFEKGTTYFTRGRGVNSPHTHHQNLRSNEHKDMNRGKRKRPEDSSSPSANDTPQSGNQSTMTSSSSSTRHQTSTSCIKFGYQVVSSVNEWLDGYHQGDDSSSEILPLVDLRSYSEFNERHLSIPSNNTNTTTLQRQRDNSDVDVPIVNLPLPTLISGERSCELPPRHVEFAILIPQDTVHSFQQEDAAADSSIHQLFFAVQSKSTLQSRKPWLVRQVLLEDDSLWKDAQKLNMIQEHGDTSGNDRTTMFPFQRLARLWKPDPLISSEILPLLKMEIDRDRAEERSKNQCDGIRLNQHNGYTGLVFDLGSGAGRDVCFLAEELKEYHHTILPTTAAPPQPQTQTTIPNLPMTFIGIDNHKGSSKRCLPLWKNRGVGDVTSSSYLDLNKLQMVHDYFAETCGLHGTSTEKNSNNTTCVFAIRFLNRKLFSYIARSSSEPVSSSSSKRKYGNEQTPKSQRDLEPPPLFLPVGTIFAVSHFCKAIEGSSWNFDHPKESAVLERCELKQMFGDSCGSARWEVLTDTICSDGDHGRTLIQFVARKIA